MEILRRCSMMDYKSMVTNLKKLGDFGLKSYFLDATMYIWLIISLMYLVNTKPDIFFGVSALS